jgi:hypothetical protein
MALCDLFKRLCRLIIDKALPASVLLERPERLARLAGVMVKVGSVLTDSCWCVGGELLEGGNTGRDAGRSLCDMLCPLNAFLAAL